MFKPKDKKEKSKDKDPARRNSSDSESSLSQSSVSSSPKVTAKSKHDNKASGTGWCVCDWVYFIVLSITISHLNDSKDDFHTGCRNVSQNQQRYKH